MSRSDFSFNQAMSPADKIQILFDQLAEVFTTGEFYSAVHSAKLEFFEKAGTVSEEDTEFEMRMASFMEWYLIDRDLPKIDLPPVSYYLREHGGHHSEEEIEILQSFTKSNQSIYEVKKIKSDEILLVDLFKNEKFKVNLSPFTPTMTKGELFEGRLIPYQGSYFLAQGICFHPTEMRKFILGEIKKIRHMGKNHHRTLMLKLSAMKLKHTRYQHIDPKYIYSETPAF